MAGYVFEDVELPPGFALPPSFFKIMATNPIPYYEPWWFLTEFPNDARYWFCRFARDYPERVLIPFAKFGVDEDLACFDGTDISGDPVVHLVHAGASPGWEDRGKVANFDAWIELAKEKSAEWKAEREDNSA